MNSEEWTNGISTLALLIASTDMQTKSTQTMKERLKWMNTKMDWLSNILKMTTKKAKMIIIFSPSQQSALLEQWIEILNNAKRSFN